jgi:hypothetical protein
MLGTWPVAGRVAGGFGRGAGDLVKAAILTRLWANTPCPHQIGLRAPLA